MQIKIKLLRFLRLYIYFFTIVLFIIFFSTAILKANSFKVSNLEISEPFELNFDKNKVIDRGFKLAFINLISMITTSGDKKKIQNTSLKVIKGMVDSFTISKEKFIDETYYANIDVVFNKKNTLFFLEKKNIFPSIPLKKKLLFIPIIIDENKNDLLIYSGNKIYDEWNNHKQKFHLIEYILPTEDLEDYNLIKNKFDLIEQYDFKEITDKYYLRDSIIVLIFKNEKELRILSRITVNENVVLKNLSYKIINFNDNKQIENIINYLKIIYEDYWKNFNQINTSIKLPLKVKISNSDNSKILEFEDTLNKIDSINDFYILKFDKDFTFYQIIFNGTSDVFLKNMYEKNYKFNTQNKIWILK
mgnify:CR=1 FL=1